MSSKRGQEIINKKLKERTKTLLKYVKNGKVDKPLIRKRISVSERGDKKYKVITPMGKKIHFGSRNYEHFKDSALGTYKHLDHGDVKRRASYKARHKAIKTKDGKFAYLNPEQPSFYSMFFLWD
jgi:hypothetical protein